MAIHFTVFDETKIGTGRSYWYPLYMQSKWDYHQLTTYIDYTLLGETFSFPVFSLCHAAPSTNIGAALQQQKGHRQSKWKDYVVLAVQQNMKSLLPRNHGIFILHDIPKTKVVAVSKKLCTLRL